MQKVLIIGYGKMGKIHGKYLTEMKLEWEYTDINIRRKEIWHKYINFYTHIIIATPYAAHKQVFDRLAAFEGLILIEKPVVIQRDHLEVLRDSRVMAGLNERYNPVTHYLQDVQEQIKRIDFYRDGSASFEDVAIHDIDIACQVLGTEYEITRFGVSYVDAVFNNVPISIKVRPTRQAERYALVTFNDESIVTADFKNQEVNNAPLKKCSTIQEQLRGFMRGYFGEDEWLQTPVAYHSHKFFVECLEHGAG